MSDPDLAGSSARWRRRTIWHAGLGSASAIAVIGAAPLLKGNHPGWVFGYSVASAHVSFFWLAVALLIAPSRILLGRSAPLQLDIRRDVGIWAALMAVVHTVFGLQGHMQGRFWEYFVVRGASGWTIRRDLFGFANYLGLGGLGLALLLLGLSNDWALRRLGARLWKRCQQSTYGLFVLVLAHGLVFQQMGRRPWPLVVVLLTLGSLAVAGQGSAYWARFKVRQRAT